MTKQPDWSWKAKSWEEITYAYIDIIKEGIKNNISPWSMINKITTNRNQARVLQDLIWNADENGNYNFSWLEDMEKIAKAYNDQWRMAEDLAKKKEKLEASFWIKYKQAVSAYTNWTVDAAQKMSPAMSWLAEIITTMFDGWKIDMVKYNKIFDDTYNKLKDSNPLLAKMVDYMKKFWNYVSSWEAEKSFLRMVDSVNSLINWIERFWSAISTVWNSWPMKWLRDMIWWWDITVAIVWYSALKLAVAGAFGTVFSTAWVSLAWAITWIWWASIWTTIAAAFVGYKVGEWMFNQWKWATDADKKKDEEFKKNMEETEFLKTVTYQSGTATEEQKIRLENKLDEKVKLNNLEPWQTSMLSWKKTPNSVFSLEYGIRNIGVSVNDLIKILGPTKTKQFSSYETPPKQWIIWGAAQFFGFTNTTADYNTAVTALKEIAAKEVVDKNAQLNETIWNNILATNKLIESINKVNFNVPLSWGWAINTTSSWTMPLWPFKFINPIH